MRPLYEIDQDFYSCIDMETGEIIDLEKLKALEMEREAKIEGVILWRKDILAEYEAVKNEYQALKKRAETLNNQADSLKSYINYALNGEKFKTAKCSVSYRNNTSIVIDDISKVSQAYWGAPKEEWISKTKIKEAIAAGIKVDGAHQEEKQSIIIK